MAEILKIECQDENGNIYYSHTSADVVFCADGETVEQKLVALEEADRNINNNLSPDGIVLSSDVVTFFSNESWKSGNIVTLHIGFTANYALTANTVMIILPAAIRPLTNFFTPLYGFTKNIVGLAEINAKSGNITLKLDGLATNVNTILNATYII